MKKSDGDISRIPDRPRRAITHLRAADPALARVIDSAGPFRIREKPADLQAFCRAVIGQQLSTIVAGHIAARFNDLVGEPFTPRRILRLSEEQLRGAGLSRAKAATIRELATFWQRERLSHERLEQMPDTEILDSLTRVKGIGPWTVKMILIFCLRRADVLPHEDLGLRAGIRKIDGLDDIPTHKEAIARAAAWTPWSSIATWYCWRALDSK